MEMKEIDTMSPVARLVTTVLSTVTVCGFGSGRLTQR